MDSNIPALEAADLSNLNDKDKAELRQFITNEQQRTRIQARKNSSSQHIASLAT
jgi:import inner membrane translocase subunit TIM8